MRFTDLRCIEARGNIIIVQRARVHAAMGVPVSKGFRDIYPHLYLSRGASYTVILYRACDWEYCFYYRSTPSVVVQRRCGPHRGVYTILFVAVFRKRNVPRAREKRQT